MNKPKPLLRAVLKEELVALTGDWLCALALNQFLYWGLRVADFRDFLKEEARRRKDGKTYEELDHGWIWKSMKEFKEELLLVGVSEETIRRRIQSLLSEYDAETGEMTKEGWLDWRANPEDKRDRTYQYRPNILKIQQDLHELGYALDGYALAGLPQEEESIPQNEEWTPQDEEWTPQNEGWTPQNVEALPETTTETTTEITAEKTTTTAEGRDLPQNEEWEANQELRASVVVLLSDIGVKDEVAENIVGNHAISEIMAKVEMLEMLQESKPEQVSNPGGWLRKAIEEDYRRPPPRGKAKRAKDDPDRYLGGKYQEYIQH